MRDPIDPIEKWFEEVRLIWSAIFPDGWFLQLVVFFGLLSLISLGWQGLEILMCGETHSSDADLIVGLAFAFTAYKLMRAKHIF